MPGTRSASAPAPGFRAPTSSDRSAENARRCPGSSRGAARAPGRLALRGGQPLGETAGGHGAPAARRDPDQRLALPPHGVAVLVPVRVLAGDAAVVLHQRL